MQNFRPDDHTGAQTSGGTDISAPLPPSLLVGAKQAAKLLGISPRLLWDLTDTRELTCIRIGRRVLYPLSALENWVESQIRRQAGR